MASFKRRHTDNAVAQLGANDRAATLVEAGDGNRAVAQAEASGGVAQESLY